MIERLPNYIKPTIFLSIIMGLAFGIMLLIPIVQLFMIFVFWIVGGVIVYLLKRNNFVGQFGQKEGIIIGSVSGMATVVAAAISFVPLSMLIGAIFNTVSVNFLFTTSFFSSIFSLFVLIMLIFFIGLMNIIFNVGSALLAISIINSIEPKEEITEFKIEM